MSHLGGGDSERENNAAARRSERPRRLKPIDAFSTSASSGLYLILIDFFKAQGQNSRLLLKTPTKKKKEAELHLEMIKVTLRN